MVRMGSGKDEAVFSTAPLPRYTLHPMDRLIITIDGPAGSGKSTVARRLAAKLGLDFLDTGAMYRGIAALALDRGIDPATESHAVVQLARGSSLRFDWQADPPRLLVRDRDMTARLRDADVTASVSDVAALAAVRQVLVQAQRAIGQEHPRLVSEGRDQGSVVFPDAQVKFYLEATPAVRAQRRMRQLREAGRHVDLTTIHEQIVARDHKDSTRKTDPLICPEDARRIDTSDMTLDQVVDHLEQIVLTATRTDGSGAAS